MKRYLILEDGSVFAGEGFGAESVTTGEIVFNTGMSGYQETITDQSYNGQIITFTYPLIGNAGINRDDYESINPTAKGVVVKNLARVTGNWRAQMSLDEFLKRKHIPGISGIDTRALTKRLRSVGTMKASIVDAADAHAFDQLKALVLPKKSGPTSGHHASLSCTWHWAQRRSRRFWIKALDFTRTRQAQLQLDHFATNHHCR